MKVARVEIIIARWLDRRGEDRGREQTIESRCSPTVLR
jgi:hypothetical protein